MQTFQIPAFTKETIATATNALFNDFSGNFLICDISEDISVSIYNVWGDKITSIFSQSIYGSGSETFDRNCLQLTCSGDFNPELITTFQERRQSDIQRINQDLLNHSKFTGLFHHKSLIVFGNGYTLTCSDAEVAFFSVRQTIESLLSLAGEFVIDRIILTGSFSNFFFCQQTIESSLNQLGLKESDLYFGFKETIGIRLETFNRHTLTKQYKNVLLLDDGVWTEDAIELFSRPDIEHFGNEITVQLYRGDALCPQSC